MTQQSPSRAQSSSRQASPAKEKKKKKYKVETPSKLKSIVPKDVKKWLLDIAVRAIRYEDEFDTEQELVLHLFSLLDGELADWGLPFQAKLLSESRFQPAPIRTIQEFREGILAAFGDPDAKRATARKIVELTQTGTTVEYTTKFRTITADLNWNEAAYMGQYIIDAVQWENEESRPKKEKTKEKEKNKTTQGSGSTTKEKEGLCIKCGESGHNIKECPNGWRKSKLKKEDKKEVKRESAKVAQDKPEEIEIEAELGKE
ncbi:hypothetical protein FRC11_007461 [Ceratobasidium sp. 423]|nr:hypothetical protein FRC11_007461 [Ceratobasidium sp. 423]